MSNSKAIKNDELKQELTRDEGVRYKPYTCSEGRLTIGIGHNLDDRGLPPHIVDALYEWDIGQAVKDLDHHLPWWDTLGDVRGRALINMAFNLGITRLLSFKKMLEALKAGEYSEAGEHALDSKWATQVGSRAHRIAYMLRTGQTCPQS